MVKMRFFDIKWDTDNRPVDGLPTAVTMDVDVDAGADINLEGAGLLSDRFGWCVQSFQFACHA
jgi:hypothetical protein